jgi:hypothetical protein
MSNDVPGWRSKPSKIITKEELGTKKGGVSFDPAKFDTLIQQQGVRVKIFRSAFCPNVKDISSQQHNIDCQICKGHGFIDLYPKQALAVLQNQDFSKIHNPEGFVDGNTVSATFERGIELQYYTLVELCDFTDIFFDLIKRQRGNVDVLRYKACNVNFLMDSTGKQYLKDSDYSIDENGSIKWVPAKAPPVDTIYTIHYEIPLRYRAIRAMHTNRYVQDGRKSDSVTMVKMSEQWSLVRDYLVDRTDKNGVPLKPNVIKNESDDLEEDS